MSSFFGIGGKGSSKALKDELTKGKEAAQAAHERASAKAAAAAAAREEIATLRAASDEVQAFCLGLEARSAAIAADRDSLRAQLKAARTTNPSAASPTSLRSRVADASRVVWAAHHSFILVDSEMSRASLGGTSAVEDAAAETSQASTHFHLINLICFKKSCFSSLICSAYHLFFIEKVIQSKRYSGFWESSQASKSSRTGDLKWVYRLPQ